MTSLKLHLGGLLLAALLVGGSCAPTTNKDCKADGSCPTQNLCDTCTTPASCGVTCTTTPRCSTCNTSPTNPPEFTCSISSNGGAYTTFTGKVMNAWVYEEPKTIGVASGSTGTGRFFVVIQAQAYDAVGAVNDQICVSLVRNAAGGVGTYPLAANSTTAALAYIPKTGTPYSTHKNNSGSGSLAITSLKTTDSTLAGTFGTTVSGTAYAIKPFPTQMPTSATTLAIKDGSFKNIKFKSWFKASTLTAQIATDAAAAVSWTPEGIVRAHPGGEPKDAHRLVIEAPFILNASKRQKMVLRVPLNIGSAAAYSLSVDGSIDVPNDYKINFTDAAATGYSLKSGVTSKVTSPSHDLKLRTLRSNGSTFTLQDGATTMKAINNCNFSLTY